MKLWQPGTLVATYTLTGPVARGGMGEIWLARPASGPGPSVVIKRMLGHDDDDGVLRQMLLDEARISSLLDHPHIVRVLALGREDDSTFIVMEYLHGENLSVVVRRGLQVEARLPPICIAHLGAQIASALAYAHAAKAPDGLPLALVHRDVTPQNIVLTYDGVAKLIDFGIARARGRSTVTQEGEVKGKLAYMSPEQGRGAVIDGRSDVFSLGVVLYELLAKKRFHTATDELSMFRVLIEDGPFPKLEPGEADVPQAVASIVNRALHVKPGDRPVAAQVADVLSEWVRSTGVDPQAELCAWLRRVLPERFPDAPHPIEVTATPANVGDDEWFSTLPALDAAGRMIPPAPAPEPETPERRPEPEPEPEPSPERPKPRLALVPKPPAAAEDSTAATSAPEPPPPERSGRRALLVMAGLAAAAAAAGGFWLWPRASEPGAASVLITSEPSGAEIRIGGRAVGTTPFAATNTWVGRTEVELRLHGFAPARASFDGGTEARVSVPLKRHH